MIDAFIANELYRHEKCNSKKLTVRNIKNLSIKVEN